MVLTEALWLEISCEAQRALDGRFAEAITGIHAQQCDAAQRYAGSTVAFGMLAPPARPQAATAPPYSVCARTLTRASPPTVSIPAPQRSFCSGPPSTQQLLPADEGCGAEACQVVVRRGPPGRGRDRIAAR